MTDNHSTKCRARTPQAARRLFITACAGSPLDVPAYNDMFNSMPL